MNDDGLRENLAAAHASARARIVGEQIEARVFEWIDKNTTLNSATTTYLEDTPHLADLIDETATHTLKQLVSFDDEHVTLKQLNPPKEVTIDRKSIVQIYRVLDRNELYSPLLITMRPRSRS